MMRHLMALRVHFRHLMIEEEHVLRHSRHLWSILFGGHMLMILQSRIEIDPT